MTVGYQGDTGFDLDTLDELFEQAALADPAVGAAMSRSEAAIEIDDLLLESDGRSVPDSAALSTLFWRVVRTVGPIMLADLVSLALAGLFARAVMWFVYPSAMASVSWAAPLALIPLVAAYWLSDLYSEIWVHPAIELRQLTRVSTMGLLAVAAGGMLAWPFPLWCAAAWPALLVLLPLMRSVARGCCAGRDWWGYPILVIASTGTADGVARALINAPASGLRPLLLTDPHGDCQSAILPVVNEPAMLESMIRSKAIRHAVIALPELSSARMGEMLDHYSGLVPHLLVLPDCSALPTLWGASRSGGRLSGMEVRNGLMLATLKGAKRAIDLIVAASALILSLPLLAVAAAAVKLTSRGPVFYSHGRIGRHGQPFKAWKIRTMRPNSDSILQEHLERFPAAREEWARDHKLRNDPRITAIGRFLRKTSLDELPQIWNVLKGNMSLVGPRPIVEGEILRYDDAFLLYTTVKPGITGMWQISGRNDIGYRDRVRLDQFYIRHWSPWLDIYIMARTIVILINRHGAY